MSACAVAPDGPDCSFRVRLSRKAGCRPAGLRHPVMGQNFIACDREQSFLMPPDVREWLPEGHLAWFVIDAVEEMDLGAFYGAYRARRARRPAYEPAMMVALLLYAYARGMRSSRAIERACEEDVAFRVIAAQQRPDHATIARFVERHEDALAGLFGEVLGLCAQAGLATVGVVAIDGTKVHANASRDANLDYEQIAREILEEAKAVDAAEDELYGEARGDELPPELRPVEGAASGCAKPSASWTSGASARPGRFRGHGPTRLKEAKRRLEEELFTEVRANAAYEAYRARGRDEDGRRLGRTRHPSPTSRRRSRRARSTSPIPTRASSRGCAGSSRATTPRPSPTSDQIVIAAEVMVASPDFGHLEPMLHAARAELAAAGVTDTP